MRITRLPTIITAKVWSSWKMTSSYADYENYPRCFECRQHHPWRIRGLWHGNSSMIAIAKAFKKAYECAWLQVSQQSPAIFVILFIFRVLECFPYFTKLTSFHWTISQLVTSIQELFVQLLIELNQSQKIPIFRSSSQLLVSLLIEFFKDDQIFHKVKKDEYFGYELHLWLCFRAVPNIPQCH